jgi:transposase-like protein
VSVRCGCTGSLEPVAGDPAAGRAAGRLLRGVAQLVRHDDADQGERSHRPTTGEIEELRRLLRENAELKRANEILKVASTFRCRT